MRFTDEHLRSIGWGKVDLSMCEKKKEEDSDSSSEDSYDEAEIHNTSDGPVMLKMNYEWTGAPGVSDMVKKMTGCQLMREIDKLMSDSAKQGRGYSW